MNFKKLNKLLKIIHKNILPTPSIIGGKNSIGLDIKVSIFNKCDVKKANFKHLSRL